MSNSSHRDHKTYKYRIYETQKVLLEFRRSKLSRNDFKTNKQNVLSSNLEPKVKAFKTCLQQWSHRKLTLMGKIVVIKNCALPKLIYPLTSLQNPPKETIKHIEQLMYSFIWDNKPDKIKRNLH